MMMTNTLTVDWKSATVETTERLFIGQSQDLHETGEKQDVTPPPARMR